jgi:hypothetical protein
MQSHRTLAPNFSMGTACQRDDYTKAYSDKQYNSYRNSADNMLKKEARWKQHVVIETQGLRLNSDGTAIDTLPEFMQSPARACAASPFQPPPTKGNGGADAVYGDAPHDSRMSRPYPGSGNTARAKLSARSDALVASARGQMSVRSTVSRASARSARSSASRKSTSRSSARQTEEVKKWIQEEFGKAGDTLAEEIEGAASSIVQNSEKLNKLEQSLGALGTSFATIPQFL